MIINKTHHLSITTIVQITFIKKLVTKLVIFSCHVFYSIRAYHFPCVSTCCAKRYLCHIYLSYTVVEHQNLRGEIYLGIMGTDSTVGMYLGSKLHPYDNMLQSAQNFLFPFPINYFLLRKTALVIYQQA